MNTDNSLSLTTATAGIYTDFDGLTRLRGQAAEQTPESKKEVARQFEALFIQIMLKSMRDASQLSESTDGDQTRFYQDMFDKQVSLDLASGSGIGLASVIERQLGVVPSVQAPADKIFTDTAEQNWKPDGEEAFVRDLWPQAVDVAAELGVDPEVLIAQSALETGWGQKMIRDQHGQTTLNLFGIKADDRWQGERASVSTLEYRDGIARQEHAAFRSYASRADSMQDYANFLRENPRYQQALDSAGDAKNYLQELQRAGYATDPAYANKISAIMQRDLFVQTVAELKVSENISQPDFSL